MVLRRLLQVREDVADDALVGLLGALSEIEDVGLLDEGPRAEGRLERDLARRDQLVMKGLKLGVR